MNALICEASRPRTFHNYAADYAEHGLVVFPVGGEDGKKPLVSNWRKFKPNTWEKLAERFAYDNIGIVNDSGLTVIDIDDPKLAVDALKNYGDTPIKIGTPKGGYHFWYKSAGEGRLISINGQKIDQLGKGGFSVAPPSIRPNKGSYYFIEGSAEDIPRLPTMKGSIQANTQSENIKTGFRNNTLFKKCLQAARNSRSEADLLNYAIIESNKFELPLQINEIQKIVQSAWYMQLSGTNWVGGNKVGTPRVWLELLKHDRDAFYLMVFLKSKHNDIRETFFIDQERVGELIGIKSRKVMRRLIRTLIKAKLVEKIGKVRRAYVYQFTS